MSKRLNANFSVIGTRVIVDWGEWLRRIDVDYTTAFEFADAFIRLGKLAERVAKGHPEFTKKEVTQLEERIARPGHRLLDTPVPPLVGIASAERIGLPGLSGS